MTEEILKKVQRLVEIKAMADGGVESVTNQGQAMDGYSELANYRDIIKEIEELIETVPRLKSCP
jgi:hypothetical protein